jgi:hypothetical protein
MQKGADQMPTKQAALLKHYSGQLEATIAARIPGAKVTSGNIAPDQVTFLVQLPTTQINSPIASCMDVNNVRVSLRITIHRDDNQGAA